MKKTLTTIAIGSLLGAGISQAVLVSFDGSTSSSVNDATNWDTNTLPTTSDDVVIGLAFAAVGSIGASSTADAGSLLVQGSLAGTWLQGAATTVDGGSISLSGAGGAYGGGGTTNLINGGTFTFTKKTASEITAYTATFSVDGVSAVFGLDPLAIEPGDTALVTENAGSGLDNVTVSIVPEPSSAALLGLGGLALILRRRK